LSSNCQIRLLAARLRELRGLKSLYAVEHDSGISRGNLLRYEKGVQIPENDALQRLADYYQIEFLELKKLWVADLFPIDSLNRQALDAWLKDMGIQL
jgi:transcriptional regulator with XRE-family HTH domain